MYECNIIYLGIKTESEYFNSPYNYIKNKYHKIYLDNNGCVGFDNSDKYIDYIPIYQNKSNIVFTIDNAYKKINKILYESNIKYINNFVLNYGDLGENITLSSINYLDVIINDKIKFNDVILQVTDYVLPDLRLNIFPLQNYWWTNNNIYNNNIDNSYNDIDELIYYINFPGILGYYASVISPGFLCI